MIIQGTPEWFAARLGKVTASRIADLSAKTKTGWSASRANYMAELLVERLTGRPTESYTNAAMAWGSEQEPFARQAYAERAGVDVWETGFVDHPELDMTGASPDGLIGEAGLVEIKCPNTATHIDALLGAPIAEKYVKQMQWQMACCGREWCDYVSYDPRVPATMQLHITRVPRDHRLIVDLEAEVSYFLTELADKERRLRERYAAIEDAA